MALITPSIPVIIPFSTTSDYALQFNVGIGGSQVIGNNLIIQRNSDSVEIYNQEIANFLYTHIIPSSTLVNGVQYKAKVRTKDINGNYSSFSDWTLFYCFSLPTISITNVSEAGIVTNSTYTFLGSYSQAETDTIKSFRFLLYDSNEVLLQSYPEVIGSTITQVISGLNNNQTYHIELKVISQHNVEVSTGLIGFTIQYIAPALQNTLTLTNLPSQGAVEIQSVAIQIEGTGNGQIYESSDWINLTSSGAYAFFNKHLFSITSDFALKLHLKSISSNTVFLTILGDNGSLTIKYYGNRFHVFKTASGLTSHFINSSDISIISTDKVCLEIKQINNLIDVVAQIYT